MAEQGSNEVCGQRGEVQVRGGVESCRRFVWCLRGCLALINAVRGDASSAGAGAGVR